MQGLGIGEERADLEPKRQPNSRSGHQLLRRQVIFGQILGWIGVPVKQGCRTDLHFIPIAFAEATTEFLIAPTMHESSGRA